MIWCLHGFLGRSADWQPFESRWSEAAGMPVRAIDLFAKPLPPETPAQWAAKFVRAVKNIDDLPILVGYSLGGRLALHALIAEPEAFRGAVIIAAGLGVEGEEARQERRVRDDWWAARFESEPWDVVIRDWNAQPILAGSPEPERDEMEYDRDALATALRWWSPAVQKPLAPLLPDVATRLLWIAGERDQKYADEARRAAAALPDCTLWIAPGAGHRVPWDVPGLFGERVAEFVADVVTTSY
ncbi:MAG TPA: alpha/beta fold hydrolase [Thermoanaerobaculia bacterium]